MHISYLTSKDRQMTKKYLKKCSMSVIICEEESKITEEKQLALKQDIKCQQGCKIKRNVDNVFGKSVGSFTKENTMMVPQNNVSPEQACSASLTSGYVQT